MENDCTGQSRMLGKHCGKQIVIFTADKVRHLVHVPGDRDKQREGGDRGEARVADGHVLAPRRKIRTAGQLIIHINWLVR